jgi:hypothetical protein
MNMCLSHIAAALDALNDSHTFFLPPQHVVHTEYGFHYQFVGERAWAYKTQRDSSAPWSRSFSFPPVKLTK